MKLPKVYCFNIAPLGRPHVKAGIKSFLLNIVKNSARKALVQLDLNVWMLVADCRQDAPQSEKIRLN